MSPPTRLLLDPRLRGDDETVSYRLTLQALSMAPSASPKPASM